MPLKVLSLNVWNDQGPWSRRAELIREWIERLEPDLIGFQEVLLGGPPEAKLDQLGELVGSLGFHTDYVPSFSLPDRPALEFGNAIASRWPISAREALELPDRGDWEKRSALCCSIESPHGRLTFSNTHLHWRFEHGHVREKQVAALADQVDRLAPKGGFPPIVVGDFNAEPDSDEIRFMQGLHAIDRASVAFLDAWRVAGDVDQSGEAGEGITWSNRNDYARIEFEPRRRIDYIFVGLPGRAGLGWVERCEVVCDEARDGVWPTDHFGVYAELRTDPAG